MCFIFSFGGVYRAILSAGELQDKTKKSVLFNIISQMKNL